MPGIARIQVLNGTAQGYYELPSEGKFVIGREDGCQVVIHDLQISRQHCNIERKDKRIILTDTSSSVTLVNGHAIERCELLDEDVVTVNNTAIRFLAPHDERYSKRKSEPVYRKDRHSHYISKYPAAQLLNEQCGPFMLASILKVRRHLDVYLGLERSADPEGDPRLAVIKVLGDPSRLVPTDESRFLHTPRVFSEITHERIPRIEAQGSIRGRPFYAASILPGDTLAALLEKTLPLDQESALSYAIGMLDLMRVFHQKDQILAGLSPDSIMVDPMGNAGLISADHVIEVGKEITPRALFAGANPNVLFHLAPEMFGEKTITQIRSDIFAVASILYFMLCGSVPWEPRQRERTTIMWLAAVNEATFKASDPVPLHERVKNVHPRIWPAISIAIEVDPANRYASIEPFVKELKAIHTEILKQRANKS